MAAGCLVDGIHASWGFDGFKQVAELRGRVGRELRKGGFLTQSRQQIHPVARSAVTAVGVALQRPTRDGCHVMGADAESAKPGWAAGSGVVAETDLVG